MLAWASAGVSLPHSAALQYADFPHVSLTALQPGDLLFYDLDGSGIDHVVMYVGPDPRRPADRLRDGHHHPGRPHRHRGHLRSPLVLRAGRCRPSLSGRVGTAARIAAPSTTVPELQRQVGR